jgi:hypothetical protein
MKCGETASHYSVVPRVESDWIAKHIEAAWYRDDHAGALPRALCHVRPVWGAWRFALETADQLRAPVVMPLEENC